MTDHFKFLVYMLVAKFRYPALVLLLAFIAMAYGECDIIYIRATYCIHILFGQKYSSAFIEM